MLHPVGGVGPEACEIKVHALAVLACLVGGIHNSNGRLKLDPHLGAGRAGWRAVEENQRICRRTDDGGVTADARGHCVGPCDDARLSSTDVPNRSLDLIGSLVVAFGPVNRISGSVITNHMQGSGG